MNVHGIACIGLRGQMARNGAIPWISPEHDKSFEDYCKHSILLCGRVTYENRPKKLRKMLDAQQCGLVGWTRSADVSFGGLLGEFESQGCQKVIIIGGGLMFKEARPFFTSEVFLDVVPYDNDPSTDSEHTFFPLKEFNITL